MARRKSQITKRLQGIRGLLPIEKDLLKRIGELADGAINNRGPANPGISGVRKVVRSPILPPPRNLTVDIGPKNAKVEWNPVDSPVLNFYEVQITDSITNISQLKLAFTNRIYLGGPGKFSVRVRSVGRNGNASPYSPVISFEVQDDVIFLEGNSLGPTALGPGVAEDIYLPLDYRLFVWGAYNLSTFSDKGENPVPIMDLSVNGFYPIISRLFMFGENEGFSNVDDTTVPGIVRSGSGLRPGHFETSQGALFKPFYVDSATLAGLTNTESPFYMFLNQRDDTTNASISMLSIPATLSEINEEPLNIITSINNFNGGKNLATLNFPNQVDFGFGNQFTIGIWMKNFENLAFNRGTRLTINNLGTFAQNRPPFGVPGVFTTEDNTAYRVDIGGAGLFPIGPDGIETSMQNPFVRNIARWKANDLVNNKNELWNFYTFTYDSTEPDDIPNKISEKHQAYFNGVRMEQLEGFADLTGMDAPTVDGQLTLELLESSGQLTYETSQGTPVGTIPARVFYMAIWDGLLGDGVRLGPLGGVTADEIAYLSNNPLTDLRSDEGNYSSSGQLVHWWRFGDDPDPATETDLSSDLGLAPPVSITANAAQAALLTELREDAPRGPGGLTIGVGEDSSSSA